MGAVRQTSWLHLWVLLGLVILTIPDVLLWWFASEASHEPDAQAVGWGVLVPLMLATVLLGSAMGWQHRWTTLWIAVVLGALVQSVGAWVAYARGWSGGEPLPEPAPFLMSCAILTVLLGSGALTGESARGARERRRAHGA